MAAGQTLYSAGAMGAITPATAGATLDTRAERPVLDFADAVTDDQAWFQGVLPAHYSGGDLEIAIHWMATTATSAVCVWLASFERLAAEDNDLDTPNFEAEVTVNGTAVSPSGAIIETVITLTALDSAVAGDSFRVLIERTGTAGADLMSGDAELLDISIKEA